MAFSLTVPFAASPTPFLVASGFGSTSPQRGYEVHSHLGRQQLVGVDAFVLQEVETSLDAGQDKVPDSRKGLAELQTEIGRFQWRLAEEKGWTLRRIKIDDGCYEIDGTDAEGRRIEVTLHPATLQVIELEYEEHGDDRSRRDRKPRSDE